MKPVILLVIKTKSTTRQTKRIMNAALVIPELVDVIPRKKSSICAMTVKTSCPKIRTMQKKKLFELRNKEKLSMYSGFNKYVHIWIQVS